MLFFWLDRAIRDEIQDHAERTMIAGCFWVLLYLMDGHFGHLFEVTEAFLNRHFFGAHWFLDESPHMRITGSVRLCC